MYVWGIKKLRKFRIAKSYFMGIKNKNFGVNCYIGKKLYFCTKF